MTALDEGAVAKANGGDRRRVRMTGQERREQLLEVARTLFAERGYDSTSIEEIADRADVSKPVVYEHFGGKEGLYAVLVDRTERVLLDRITTALDADHPRAALEQAAEAFLGYIEAEPDGFRVLTRDAPPGTVGGGTYASLLGDVAAHVESLLAAEFKQRGFSKKIAPVYARALVGMVALVGEWWLDARKPSREVVADLLVDLAWNGLRGMRPPD